MARPGSTVERSEFGLNLTAEVRQLLLEPKIFLPEGFAERLTATPSGQPVVLDEEVLEDLLDAVGANLNAAEESGDRKRSSKLDRLCDKVEELLDEALSTKPILFGGGPFSNAVGEFDAEMPILDLRGAFESEDEPLPTTTVASLELTKSQRDVLIAMNTIPDDLRQMLKVKSKESQAFQLNLRQAMVLALAAAEAMYTGTPPSALVHLAKIAEQLAGQLPDDTEPDWVASDVAPRTPPKLDTYYQLKITLDRSKPPIWRRVRVTDCTLGELHLVVQMAMGWGNDHLHSFRVGDESYGCKDFDEFDSVFDEQAVLLSEIMDGGLKKFHYWYDFGDDWMHTIQIESTHKRTPDEPLAVCTKGKRACPPEDCGGIHGYYEMLETISDPDNEDYDGIIDWLGGPIDPEAFDIQAANAQMSRFVEG